MSLHGKVALITGGGKNLGAETARQLANEKSNLALHYNSPAGKEQTQQVADEIAKTYNVKVTIHQGDLTTAGAVTKLFKETLEQHGRVDIVINNVGKVLKKPAADVSEEEYDEMFAVNSKAAFFILKEASKHVSDGGKIITVATSLLAAFTGYYTSYAGAKAPVEHFTRGIAKELMPRRVSVNAIAPGPMNTPFFFPQESDEAVAFHKSMALDGRLTEVSDIAPIITFLCTAGQWINGQTIFANGGYTTR
ncbi:NAD(P)-binding protein [Polychaeton citri CBS 116435]|uniref:NAD(P)-binding protein n=1 Tax=Polychaeton citri CBS 116435 TaxID=1314669 RepID=A0A9P4QF81_9PEZI|nr:NAD(P)-binding protein [Polychaeton citri CBS 116435]